MARGYRTDGRKLTMEQGYYVGLDVYSENTFLRNQGECLFESEFIGPFVNVASANAWAVCQWADGVIEYCDENGEMYHVHETFGYQHSTLYNFDCDSRACVLVEDCGFVFGPNSHQATFDAICTFGTTHKVYPCGDTVFQRFAPFMRKL